VIQPAEGNFALHQCGISNESYNGTTTNNINQPAATEKIDFSIQAKAGRRYKLQTSIHLKDWNTIETIAPMASDQLLEFATQGSTANKFYRVKIELP